MCAFVMYTAHWIESKMVMYAMALL